MFFILITDWTRIELCAGQCYYQQRWLRHPQKQMQHRWICFWMWFTPFDSMVRKCITFSPKNHPHHLHFLWRNSITGWTISTISTSLHQALMDRWLSGSMDAPKRNEKFRLRYSRKTKGVILSINQSIRIFLSRLSNRATSKPRQTVSCASSSNIKCSIANTRQFAWRPDQAIGAGRAETTPTRQIRHTDERNQVTWCSPKVQRLK